jgi:hypothetical protein
LTISKAQSQGPASFFSLLFIYIKIFIYLLKDQDNILLY